MLKFLVIGDFHYKKEMYAVTLDHFKEMMKRANDEKVDFVLHTGDFCNDYVRSPELFKAYLENEYGLEVYGIYGNHEMESGSDNTMEFITPRLCNRPVNFAFDGAPFWYKDFGNYRLIGLDSNYSFAPEKNDWEHNLPGSCMGKQGNTHLASVPPFEMEWFKNLLIDARSKGMKVIPVSHHPFCGVWGYCYNAKEVKVLLEEFKDVLPLVISGDIHAGGFCIVDDVAYYGAKAALCAWWDNTKDHHYPEDKTYKYTEYDQDGNAVKTYDRSLNVLQKTYMYFESPLSSIVTIEDDGTVTIDGCNSRWLHGIEPPVNKNPVRYPFISDKKFKI